MDNDTLGGLVAAVVLSVLKLISFLSKRVKKNDTEV
jgi:hypothetical protein